MKLSEWLDFNQPFMSCDFKVVFLKHGSMKSDDILLSTVSGFDMCKKFFGDYEIKGLRIDRYPESGGPCFKLVLWDKKEEANHV